MLTWHPGRHTIQEVLDRKYDGAMPRPRNQVNDVIKYAQRSYMAANQEPRGIKAVEKKVENYYNNPIVTRMEQGLSVRLGVTAHSA